MNYLFLLASIVSADTITITAPVSNQVVNYNTDNYYCNFVDVNYEIGRNGEVLLSNITTELFDDADNLIQSVFTNTFMYSHVNTRLQFPIIQYPQAPATLNWTINVTGFGYYNSFTIINGTTVGEPQFVDLLNTIPITLNLTGSNQADYFQLPVSTICGCSQPTTTSTTTNNFLLTPPVETPLSTTSPTSTTTYNFLLTPPVETTPNPSTTTTFNFLLTPPVQTPFSTSTTSVTTSTTTTTYNFLLTPPLETDDSCECEYECSETNESPLTTFASTSSVDYQLIRPTSTSSLKLSHTVSIATKSVVSLFLVLISAVIFL